MESNEMVGLVLQVLVQLDCNGNGLQVRCYRCRLSSGVVEKLQEE